MALTPEQEQAAIDKAIAGFDAGGGNKPKPGARKTALVGSNVISFVANQDGEWEVDTATPPKPFLPPARGGAPYTTSGGPAGVLAYNEDEQQFQAIEGTQPGGSVSWQNGVAWRFDPASGTVTPVATDAATLAKLQAESDRADAALQQKTIHDRAQDEIDRINALRQAQQITNDEAQRQWDRWYKENVEAPRANAALNLQMRQEERTGLTEVQRASEAAGTSAVADVVSRMPYMYSPGFAERRRAILDAGMRGGYAPAAAGTIQLPDLAQTRQDAQSAAQTRSAALMGIDLPGDPYAGVPPYQGPPPAGALPPSPEDDAAEWARRLAAARSRVGPAALGV